MTLKDGVFRGYSWQSDLQVADFLQANQNTTDTSHPPSQVTNKQGLVAQARAVHQFAWLNIQLQYWKRGGEAFNTDEPSSHIHVKGTIT